MADSVWAWLRCLLSRNPSVEERRVVADALGAHTPERADDDPIGLLALPSEVLGLVGAQLPLPALSALACSCVSVARRLPDECWEAPLARTCREIAARRAVVLATTSRRRAAAEEAEVEMLISGRRAEPLARATCHALRRALCCLCDTRAATSATAYAARGVCAACEHDGSARSERWREEQAAWARRAEDAKDEAARRALHAALVSSLPSNQRADGTPDVRLLFSSARHGGSLAALLRAADGHTATALHACARTDGRAAPRQFGVYVGVPWCRADRWWGSADCFLFRAAPTPATWHATGADEHYAYASVGRGVGFGGEIGEGKADPGGFGLWLSADLGTARVLPSRTYGDACAMALAEPGAEFAVEWVRLWGLRTEADEPARRRAAVGAAGSGWPDDADADTSVLDPGPNKLMLEFIGMDREAAMLRRFSG